MSQVAKQKHRFLRGLVLPTLILCAAGAAGASQCHDEKASENQLVIDFNSGEVLDGQLRYARGETVTVFLVRKNPFKYTYTSAVDVAVVDQTGLLTTFLGIGPVGPVLSSVSETDEGQPESPGSLDSPLDSSCSVLLHFQGELGSIREQTVELDRKIKAAIAPFNRTLASAESFTRIANRDLTSIASCQALESAANDTKATLSDFRLGFSKEPTDHLQEVSRIRASIESIRPRDPDCVAFQQDLLLKAIGLEKLAEELADKAEDLKKGKQAFDQTVRTIESALAQNPFFETRAVSGRGRLPTVVTIKTTRKPIQPPNAKAEPTNTVEVRFGNPFFSLSAGLGIADMRIVEFGKEMGIGTDQNGNTVEVERLVVTKESDPTALGALQLNANLARLFKSEEKRDLLFAMSLGVTAGDGDENADYGFYLGPSFAFLDGSLYFTVAYHLRERQVLGGGFEEGQTLTVELEEIPTRKVSEESFIFAVSYKIR